MITELAIEHVRWRDFLDRLEWNQGEHLSIISPTGGGKTFLLRYLLPYREWVVLMGLKKSDSELAEMIRREGWTRTREWPPEGRGLKRLVLWPTIDTLEDLPKARPVFRKFLRDAFKAGAWTVGFDEVATLTDRRYGMGLEAEAVALWQLGRSDGVTMVAATQRPAHVPLVMYSMATHLFLGRTNDDRDIRRLREVSGVNDIRSIERAIRHLPKFHFLYIDTRNGTILTTKVEPVRIHHQMKGR